MDDSRAQAPRLAPEPGHLNRPLDDPRDTRLLWVVRVAAGLWLAYQLLVPLRYYVLPDHDPYDERFSWRMFSAVRVHQCEVDVTQTLVGTERRVNLETTLPMPWIALVTRNRPAVQRELLEHLCEADARPSDATIRSRCVEPSGERAPTIVRHIRCASLEITESREPAPAAPASEGGAR